MMPFLLLRGLLREKRHWGPFPKILAERCHVDESEVYSIDLPGIGASSDENFPLKIGEAVELLREKWQSLSAGSPPIVVSVSLGSMLAIEWAKRYPQDLKGLVICNTSASNLSPITERISTFALKQFAQITQARTATQRESLILELVSRHFSKDVSKAEEWAQWAPPVKSLIHTGLRQLSVASRFQLESPISVPSLAICSLYDRLLSPSATVKVANVLKAKLVYHYESGHDLPLDDPSWFADQISLWSRELLLQPPPEYLQD